MVIILNLFFRKGEIMLDHSGNSDTKSYKSPIRKLVKFFEKSRDQWKTKHQEAKYQVKLLKNKIRHMDKSERKLKTRVKELEDELNIMKTKEKQMGQEITELKKKL
jgi:uncharacterized protein YlxW (UPF0749 family)